MPYLSGQSCCNCVPSLFSNYSLNMEYPSRIIAPRTPFILVKNSDAS